MFGEVCGRTTKEQIEFSLSTLLKRVSEGAGTHTEKAALQSPQLRIRRGREAVNPASRFSLTLNGLSALY